MSSTWTNLPPENVKHGLLKTAAISTLQRPAALHSGTVFHCDQAGKLVRLQGLLQGGVWVVVPSHICRADTQNLVLGQLCFNFSPLDRGS